MKFNKLFIILSMFLMMLVSVNAQIFPTSYTIFDGTYTSGSVSCLSERGQSCLVINEESSSPALDVRFNFTNVTSIQSAQIGFIHSAGSDEVDFEIWDNEFNIWQDLQEVVVTTEYTVVDRTIDNDDKFISNGDVVLRLVHDVSGNPSHVFDIYSVSLEPIPDTEYCPITEVENKNSFLLLTIIGLLMLFAIFTRTYIIGFFASFGLMMYSLTISGCNVGVFYTLFGSSILIMGYFMFGSTD